MTAKFDVFCLGLILIPVLVTYVPVVQRRVLAWSEQRSISPAVMSVGAWLIFGSNFSHPVMSYSALALALGFMLFFVGFTLAVACLKARQQN